jgi:hypothetical protein
MSVGSDKESFSAYKPFADLKGLLSREEDSGNDDSEEKP